MKLVVDMNLSPDWCSVLQGHGWDTVHWSDVGDPAATDQEIMQWALSESRVVFTHDLDLRLPERLVPVFFSFARKT